MQNNQSSYSFWTWIIALLLALILLWMLLTGKGPSNACCSKIEAPAPAAEVMPADDVEEEPFSFSATELDFSSTGDASEITWAGADIGGLKALLTGNIKAEGDSALVVLTGEVDSEALKEEKGMNAQAFFGPDVTVDNQITVAELVLEPAAAIVPPAAKLYFGSGVHRLPADSDNTLAPIINWLKNNENAKAIISGFHDLTGDPASNARLAKKRAKAAYNALLNAGIDAERIELRKPESTDGGGDLNEARRVEVAIE